MKLILLLLLFPFTINNLSTATTVQTCPAAPPYVAEYHTAHNGYIHLSFTLYDGEIVEGATFKLATDGRWQTSIRPADVPTQCPQQLALFLIYTIGTLETGTPPFTYTETTANFAAYTGFLIAHSTAVPTSPHIHYLPILTT